ncbi:Methyl-CpG-binding domain protein 5 [Ancistrocladus abbreviatus]
MEMKRDENLSEHLAGIEKQMDEDDPENPMPPEQEMEVVANACDALVLLVKEGAGRHPDHDAEHRKLEVGEGLVEKEGGENQNEEKKEVSARAKELVLRDKGKEKIMDEGEGKEIVPVVEVKEEIMEDAVGKELVVRGPMELGEEEEGKRKRKRGRPKQDRTLRPDWLPADWGMHCVVRQQGDSQGHVDRYFYNPDPESYKFRSKKEVLYFLETGIPPKTYKISKLLREQPQQQQQQGPEQDQEEEEEQQQQPPPPQNQEQQQLPPPHEEEQEEQQQPPPQEQEQEQQLPPPPPLPQGHEQEQQQLLLPPPEEEKQQEERKREQEEEDGKRQQEQQLNE